jgi:hypothetical protein
MTLKHYLLLFLGFLTVASTAGLQRPRPKVMVASPSDYHHKDPVKMQKLIR